MSGKRVVLALFLVLTLVASLLAACGPTATPVPEATEAAPPPTVAAPQPTEVPEAKDLLDLVMEAGKLVVSTDPNYAPQSFLNDKGDLDGFDINVAQEVAKRLGVDVEFTSPDWDMITGGNWGGRWDISIGSMTATEQRSEVLWFTDPYYYVPAAFAVHKDNTTITSEADFADKKVGLGTATTYEDYLNGVLSMLSGEIVYDPPAVGEIVAYSTDQEAVQDLALGDGTRLDVVMTSQSTIDGAIAEGVPIKQVGTPAFYEGLVFALDKNRGPSDKLVAKLNEIVAAMHADGTLKELSLKWFGVDYTTIVAPGEVPPPVAEEGTLIIGTTDKVTNLDPADSYDFHTWEIHHNTMDTLLHYTPGTTELEPGLAVDFPEVSADGLEYTFKLREGLAFPDGTPFNAEAYKWTIDRVIRLQGQPNWLVTAFVESVEAVDEYTVKFKLLAPSSLFPLLAATPPYSAISPNCYSADAIESDSTCGGIGAYKITKWERDVEMVLEANEGYYNPPKTAKIIVKYYADSTTLRLAVESGEIDLATKTLNPSDYVDLEAAGELQVIKGPGAQIRYLCFNATTAPFDQRELREAISYAVDRDQLTSVAFLGTHEPLYTMVPIGMWSHLDSFPKRDVEKAKELLTAAGYSPDKKLVMDLWWTPTHYGPTEADVATILKDNLEETGLIEITLQNTEWATYKENMRNGSMPVFMLGWYPDYLDPDNYTWSFAQTDASDDQGIFYSNPDMDALLVAGQQAPDLRSADRLKIYEDVQKLWVTEAPTIPLTQGSLLVVAQPNVKGVVLDPNMMYHYFLMYKE